MDAAQENTPAEGKPAATDGNASAEGYLDAATARRISVANGNSPWKEELLSLVLSRVREAAEDGKRYVRIGEDVMKDGAWLYTRQQLRGLGYDLMMRFSTRLDEYEGFIYW